MFPVRRLLALSFKFCCGLKTSPEYGLLFGHAFLVTPFLTAESSRYDHHQQPPSARRVFRGVVLAKILRARVITNISDIWPKSALELGAIQRGWVYSLLEKNRRLLVPAVGCHYGPIQ